MYFLTSACLPSFTLSFVLEIQFFPQDKCYVLNVLYLCLSSNVHRNKYEVRNPFNCTSNFRFFVKHLLHAFCKLRAGRQVKCKQDIKLVIRIGIFPKLNPT